MGVYEILSLLPAADSMAMLKSVMSIKLPAVGFDKEFYIQHSDKFAFQSSVWDSQGELLGVFDHIHNKNEGSYSPSGSQ